MPPSCALLGGFAIGARVALLWQHNTNAKCWRVHACTRSVSIIRLHCSSLYVDAAYCYRVSSVVCLSVTVASLAKTTEWIEMSFGMWTWVCTRNHVLDVLAC